MLDEAFTFANGVGALTALGKGAIEPIPNKQQVQTFLMQIENKILVLEACLFF